MCRQVLEAALLYQREHPPVPTDGNQHGEYRPLTRITSKPKNYSVEWFAAYDAPAEPELGKAARRVIDDMMGCTFTPKKPMYRRRSSGKRPRMGRTRPQRTFLIPVSMAGYGETDVDEPQIPRNSGRAR